jgi:ribosome-associated protein
MNKDILLKEVTYKAVRSSGAGGQHVNKVSTKVVISFNLAKSEGLSDAEKVLLNKTISNRLTSDQVLILSCDASRSQLKNKNIVIRRFLEILTEGLKVQKKRLPAKPSKNSIKKAKAKKSQRGELKKLRRKPDLD